jgi:UDP-N-acetyl-2-amino-2-deoxyglucuronate dehydrogenase
MKKYVLLGGAGYVAPKHYQAIKQTGGDLVAILDPHDSVGILDSFFPDCRYFSEFERFDRFCSGKDIDYTVVCSPNYLHDAHCRFGLRIGSNVICEKPLVLHEKNLNDLLHIEDGSEYWIWNILQLRLSDVVEHIRQAIQITSSRDVLLEYSVSRGPWYDYSWKGNEEKSGGILFNIGIHLFDLLLHLFGTDYKVTWWANHYDRFSEGFIRIGDFGIGVILKVTETVKRQLSIGEETFDLSKGFTDLHVKSYSRILMGDGFGIEDVRPAIKLCEELRNKSGMAE